MKVIIAGSRGITDIRVVEEAMRLCGFVVTEVVSGTASGVDRLGEQWAQKRNIPIKRFPADWAKHKRAAGFIRNKIMVEYVKETKGAVVAIWDGQSRGTSHTIDLAKEAGLQLFIHTVPQRPLEWI
jgi:hypothetical protein